MEEKMAYERAWAEEVFEDFCREHALAVREVHRLYRISTDAVVRTIQNDNQRWRGYKSLCKHVEKAMKLYWAHWQVEEKVRQKYYTFDKYLKEQLKKRSFPAPLDLVDTEIQQSLF